MPDRLVADHVDTVTTGVGLDGEGHEGTRGTRTVVGVLRSEGVPSDEVLVHLDEATEVGLERVVDRAVFPSPRSEALLESERVQRMQPEHPDPELFARLKQLLVDVALVAGRHPELVAEIAGEGHPTAPHRSEPDVDLRERHEAHAVLADVGVGELFEYRSCVRAGDRQAGRLEAERFVADRTVGGQLLVEPSLVIPLGDTGTEEHEFLTVTGVAGGAACDGRCRTFGGPGRSAERGDGEVADQVARRVGHRRECHATGVRDATGQDAIEVRASAGTAELELREAGGLPQANTRANGEGLLADLVPGVGATERDVLDGLLTFLLEPERGLQPEAVTEHGVLCRQSVVDR